MLKLIPSYLFPLTYSLLLLTKGCTWLQPFIHQAFKVVSLVVPLPVALVVSQLHHPQFEVV